MSNQQEQEQITTGFQGLGISQALLNVLAKLNLTTPTPIQRKSIPILLKGQDLIGIAQTGTGKTFAFGVPLLQRLSELKTRGLVLLPTRELALQVDQELNKLGKTLGLRTAALIGGEPIEKQKKFLDRNPHVVVATPGRLIDCIGRGFVKLRDVKLLVLDEADMMLDMGFMPQVREILRELPRERQTMLFSATIPQEIARLAEDYMSLPVSIEVAPSGTTVEQVDQEIYVVKKEDRHLHLESILKEYAGSVLIFTRTRYNAKSLTRKLQIMGHKVAEIHSNRSQGQRREALDGFKSGRYRILVATDIAARGIDVTGIALVVNFDLPDDSGDYVHRIGRTARAGKNGKAISFALPTQWKEVQDIELLIKKDLPITQFTAIEKGVPTNPVRSRAGFPKGSDKKRQPSGRPLYKSNHRSN